MKTKHYNSIIRTQYPKWCGWKILDFHITINMPISESEIYLLAILEENLYLTKELEAQI